MRNLEDFASSTTIHGIPSLINSKSMSLKLIWLFVLIISLGSLGYMAYQAAEEFFKSPTSLELSVKPLEELPTISLFIQNVINQSQVETMGLTMLHVIFLLAHSPLWTMTPEDAKKLTEADLKKMREEIVEVARSYNVSWLNLLWKLSNAGESLIYHAPDAGMYGTAILSHSPFGVYQITVANGSTTTFLGIKNLARDDPFIEHLDLSSNKFTFLVGEGHDLTRTLTVAPNTTNSFVLNPVSTQLLDRPSNPCRPGNKSLETCGVECWSGGAECQLDCTWWSNDIQNARHVLDWYTADLSGYCHSMRTRCMKKCIPPCKALKYNLEVKVQGPVSTAYGFATKDCTNVFIVYLSQGWLATVYEEKHLYSWSSFVTNLGGLMGLFFGASLISIVQFCLCLFRGHYAKKEIQDSRTV